MKDTTPIFNTPNRPTLQHQCDKFLQMLIQFHTDQVNRITLTYRDPKDIGIVREILEEQGKIIRTFLQERILPQGIQDEHLQQFLEKLSFEFPTWDCQLSAFQDYWTSALMNNYFTLGPHIKNIQQTYPEILSEEE